MAKKKQELSRGRELLKQAIVPEDEQPYEVPGNWVWTNIKQLVKLHRGVSYKKEALTEKNNGTCLVLRGGNIEEGAINLNADNVYVDLSIIKSNQLLKKNDIIIVSSTGSTKVIGKAGISCDDYNNVAFGAFLTLVRPKESVNKRFIAIFFQTDSYRNAIRCLAKGVNINNIKNESIENIILPLPPLPEQQRIVDRIESLFEKLDHAKGLIQEALDSFENRKAAILHKAFTGELTKKWREEHGVGMDSWEENPLRYYVVTLNQGWSPKCESFPSSDFDTWGVIKTTAIQHMNFIETENKQLPDHLEPRPQHELKDRDILITRAGPRVRVGVCCLVKNVRPKLLLCDKAYRINVRLDSILPEYLVMQLNTTNKLDEINEMKTGISDSGLNLTQNGFLDNILIKTPSISEQTEIVRVIDEFFEKEQKAKELSDLIENIDLMKKSILARAFRGELGTNDPAEESALELLKEVLKQ